MNKEWKKYSIGDICTLEYGKALKATNRIAGQFPVYGSNGIVGYHNKSLIEERSIIIGRKGSVGEVHISDRPFWPIDTTYYIKLLRKDVDLYWFYRLLKTLNLHNLNKSAAIPGLNRNDVYRLIVRLPSYKDQLRIANILYRSEELISKRKESIQLLDVFLESTFFNIFGVPEIMKKQKHFLLGPNIIFLTSGSRGWAKHYADKGDVFLRINNVKNASFNLNDIVYVNAPDSSEAKRTRVMEGDLLMSITADLGRTAVVSQNLAGAYINQHIALIRLKPECNINPLFLAWYFSSPYGNSFIQRKNRKGVKAGLNFDDIKNLQILKPPLALQDKFIAIVNKVELIKNEYLNSLTNPGNLYSSISQRAFKGDLDISKIPIEKESRPGIIIGKGNLQVSPAKIEGSGEINKELINKAFKVATTAMGLPTIESDNRFREALKSISINLNSIANIPIQTVNVYRDALSKAYSPLVNFVNITSKLSIDLENRLRNSEFMRTLAAASMALNNVFNSDKFRTTLANIAKALEPMKEKTLCEAIKKDYQGKLFTAEEVKIDKFLCYEYEEDIPRAIIDSEGNKIGLKDFLFRALDENNSMELKLEQVFCDRDSTTKNGKSVFLRVVP